MHNMAYTFTRQQSRMEAEPEPEAFYASPGAQSGKNGDAGYKALSWELFESC